LPWTWSQKMLFRIVKDKTDKRCKNSLWCTRAESKLTSLERSIYPYILPHKVTYTFSFYLLWYLNYFILLPVIYLQENDLFLFMCLKKKCRFSVGSTVWRIFANEEVITQWWKKKTIVCSLQQVHLYWFDFTRFALVKTNTLKQPKKSGVSVKKRLQLSSLSLIVILVF